MNMLLLHEGDFDGPLPDAGGAGRARVGGRRFRHMVEVQQLACGDEIRAGVLNGAVGKATIVAVGASGLEVELRLQSEAPPAPDLCLILALPRPKGLKRILQAVASMGIKEIFLIGTAKVEKSYWQSPVLDAGVLREQLILGLEQGCDTLMPRLAKRRLFKPFVEDEIPQLIAGRMALLAEPGAQRVCPCEVERPSALAVGPEAGFTPYEVDMLVTAGFEAVSLGTRPLRVETAVAALLGRLLKAGAGGA